MPFANDSQDGALSKFWRPRDHYSVVPPVLRRFRRQAREVTAFCPVSSHQTPPRPRDHSVAQPYRPPAFLPTNQRVALGASTVFIRVSRKGGSVLGDAVMAAALIDRLLHHCHIANIRSNSYRMREHRNLMRSASEQPRRGESHDWEG